MDEQLTCKTCWWQEGGLCYKEPCLRKENGRSILEASYICKEYKNKRIFLRRVFTDLGFKIKE
jgi:hypothetical protein